MSNQNKKFSWSVAIAILTGLVIGGYYSHVNSSGLTGVFLGALTAFVVGYVLNVQWKEAFIDTKNSFVSLYERTFIAPLEEMRSEAFRNLLKQKRLEKLRANKFAMMAPHQKYFCEKLDVLKKYMSLSNTFEVGGFSILFISLVGTFFGAMSESLEDTAISISIPVMLIGLAIAITGEALKIFSKNRYREEFVDSVDLDNLKESLSEIDRSIEKQIGLCMVEPVLAYINGDVDHFTWVDYLMMNATRFEKVFLSLVKGLIKGVVYTIVNLIYIPIFFTLVVLRGVLLFANDATRMKGLVAMAFTLVTGCANYQFTLVEFSSAGFMMMCLVSAATGGFVGQKLVGSKDQILDWNPGKIKKPFQVLLDS